MNRHHFDAEERRAVSELDFGAAIKAILLAPRTSARSENRDPTKAEVEARHRLERKG